MKKVISLLIGCSLALAGAALAQQPVEQHSPSKSNRASEKARSMEAQPRANVSKPQERPANQSGAIKERSATNERAATNEPGAEKGRKTHVGRESANAPETRASGQTSNETTNPSVTEKNRKARAHNESANTARLGEKQQAEQQKRQAEQQKRQAEQQKQQAEQQRKGVKTPATAAKSSTHPGEAGTNVAPVAGQQNLQAKKTGGAKKPAPQEVQQVKSQHANFRAQPKPQQVPAVTFNQNHRIKGSDHWQGQQYQVFRSYQPQWHDAGWYKSHYSRVELIGGGYYYFNNGYWFPAWGYNPSDQYYAYDGPIYVGHSAEPPDKVIADTQALLQQMGYYKGEVDGLLGPLTRQALASYQADNGLIATASIDEPTLDSLGLA